MMVKRQRHGNAKYIHITLAMDSESRHSAAQPRTELSMATRPGQRKMEAAMLQSGAHPGHGHPR